MLTLGKAIKMVNAAAREARKIKVKMNIAVMDATGILMAFVRQDGAWLGSADIAQRKARTALLFAMPTEKIGELSQPGSPLYQIEVSNGGLITFAGGLPIQQDGQVIGAIGVSGGKIEQDRQVAMAGLTALRSQHLGPSK